MGNPCSKDEPKDQHLSQLMLVRNPNSHKFPKGTFEVLNTGEFSSKYNISTKLGNGAYGYVYKCTLIADPNVTRAVKLVERADAVID